MAGLERSRSGAFPGFTTEANMNGELVTLDPRLTHILEVAADEFPLRVVAFSGVAGRATGTGNHPSGRGIDVLIFNESGQPMPNFNYSPSLPTYEEFAYAARRVQQELYPELDNLFRWGGFFVGGGADLMHFDVSGGGMAGGNWNDGLDEDRRSEIEAMVSYEDHGAELRYTDGRMGTRVVPGEEASFVDNRDYFGFAMDFYQRFGGSPTAVMSAQQALADRGYYDGPIDGVFGIGTSNAMARFHADFTTPLPTPRPEFVGPVTEEYPAPWTQRSILEPLAPPLPQPNPLRDQGLAPSLGYVPVTPPTFASSPLAQAARAGSSPLAQYGQTRQSTMPDAGYRVPVTPLQFGVTPPTAPRVADAGLGVGLPTFSWAPLAQPSVFDPPTRVAAKGNAGSGDAASGSGLGRATAKHFTATSSQPDKPLDSDPADVWVNKRNRQVAALNALPKPTRTRRTTTKPAPVTALPNDRNSPEEWVKRRYAELARKQAAMI